MNRLSGLKGRRCGDSAKDQTMKEFVKVVFPSVTFKIFSGSRDSIEKKKKGFFFENDYPEDAVGLMIKNWLKGDRWLLKAKPS